LGVVLTYPDADFARPLLEMERNVKAKTVKYVENVMDLSAVRRTGRP
jgi:hypothetical protein